eukprot:scaffold232997_cov33-Tisochrysis_lutea.AAC.6
MEMPCTLSAASSVSDSRTSPSAAQASCNSTRSDARNGTLRQLKRPRLALPACSLEPSQPGHDTSSTLEPSGARGRIVWRRVDTDSTA